MGKPKRDYSSYQGRTTITDVLRRIAVVLVVLVVLVIIGLIAGQKYIVYTDNGVRIEWPAFFQRDNPGEDLDPGDVSVVILPAESTQPDQSLEPEPVAQPVMAAIQVDIQSILDGTAAQLARDGGANAVVVEMKTPQGQLNFVSDEAMAANVKANSKIEGINETLTEFNTGELYTVARISCFQDQLVGSDYGCAILTNSGYRWTDSKEIRWSTPSNSAVRDYLAGLCAQLAQLGFDEVVLESCGFPTQGNLGYIKTGEAYNAELLPQRMEQFLQEIAAAMEPYDTLLSIRLDETVLTGEDTKSGLTATMIEGGINRLWMEADGGQDLMELLAQGGISDGAERLVHLVSALSDDSVAQASFE